jgi:hypothetical protein
MTEIYYLSKVLIIEGFYKGIKGIAIDFNRIHRETLVQFINISEIPTNKSEWIKNKFLKNL